MRAFELRAWRRYGWRTLWNGNTPAQGAGWRGSSLPDPGIGGLATDEIGRTHQQCPEARRRPPVAAFLFKGSARGRLSLPRGSGTAGFQGWVDRTDHCPCAQSWQPESALPARRNRMSGDNENAWCVSAEPTSCGTRVGPGQGAARSSHPVGEMGAGPTGLAGSHLRKSDFYEPCPFSLSRGIEGTASRCWLNTVDPPYRGCKGDVEAVRLAARHRRRNRFIAYPHHA